MEFPLESVKPTCAVHKMNTVNALCTCHSHLDIVFKLYSKAPVNTSIFGPIKTGSAFENANLCLEKSIQLGRLTECRLSGERCISIHKPKAHSQKKKNSGENQELLRPEQSSRSFRSR